VRLGGPTVAYSPKVRRTGSGSWVAFVTIVEGFSQLGVMKPATGNWEVLTHDRSRGQVSNIEWSRDSSRMYYDRFVDVPDGVFSVPVPRGEERLVLENAASPRVLGDGSLVLSQLNAERRAQLHRYWPADGRLAPLNAVLRDFWATVFDVSERGEVVFVGKTLDALEAPDRLYALDLKSARAVPLAPGLSFSRTTQALAVAPDGRSVVLTVDSGDSQHVVNILTDGSGNVKTLFPVTEFVFSLDVGHDGSVYLDQWDRMGEVVRLSPSGGAPEHIGYNKRSGLYIGIALPLPDGRVVVSARTGGRERLMVMGLGREPVTFAETSEETAAPMTLVAGERVAFVMGSPPEQTIALASIANGRVERRLTGPRGAVIGSMASSPDGQTIYYTASGSVWAVPVTDGAPQKVRAGDLVTVDPYRRELTDCRPHRAGRRPAPPAAVGRRARASDSRTGRRANQ
jgi:hypothetical protein